MQQTTNFIMSKTKGPHRRSGAHELGLNGEPFEAIVWGQGGACACCDRDDQPLVLDHCHSTKHVRGAVCRSCNVLLGHHGDSSARMLERIEAIEREKAELDARISQIRKAIAYVTRESRAAQ